VGKLGRFAEAFALFGGALVAFSSETFEELVAHVLVEITLFGWLLFSTGNFP
jgi:hypothetical protein